MVLAVTIRFPWPNRPWALPVLFALYTPPEVSERLGRKHHTAGELARILTRRLLGWFPERRFVLTGGGQYSTHEMTRFAHAYHTQLTFVGRFSGNANSYHPPPKYSGTGRPRVKGERQSKPEKVAAKPMYVAWYGGDQR
nr:transposase [Thalassoroseus pseudoceratinae]